MTQVLAAGQLYQVKLFAGHRVTPGSPASTPEEAGQKKKFHKQSEKSEHLNGNKTFQSQEKRDEECIWSGVSHEAAGVMYLPVFEEFKPFALDKVAIQHYQNTACFSHAFNM